MASAEDTYLKDIAFKSDLVVTPTGDLDTILGLDNLKEAIMRRIFTTPGSIIHRPTYGVGLQNYLNNINSLSTQQRLFSAIQDQLSSDPRIESVSGLSVSSDDSRPGQVIISVTIKPVGLDAVNIDLPSEGI